MLIGPGPRVPRPAVGTGALPRLQLSAALSGDHHPVRYALHFRVDRIAPALFAFHAAARIFSAAFGIALLVIAIMQREARLAQVLAGSPGSAVTVRGTGGTTMPKPIARRADLMQLALLFVSLLEQARLADDNCESAAATPYLTAIRALAQRGFDLASRLTA